MAKGKFFNGKVKKDRSAWIKYGLIGAGALLIIILFALIAAGKSKKTVVLDLKNPVQIEVNSKMPSIKDFFTTFKNYDEKKVTIGEFDITKVGSYEVEVSTTDQGTQKITVNIVDTTPPTLKLNDLVIKSGETYKIEDFIDSCTDNSNTECIVTYFNDSIDEEGNPIDYSTFTEDGNYVIKIIATDNYNNSTTPIDINLTIGDPKEEIPEEPQDKPVKPEYPEKPVECPYGDLTIDTTLYNYPIAVTVGNQNTKCAINRDLWDSEAVVNSINDFYNTDYQRLKKQLEMILAKNYPYGTNIVAYPQYSAVLNESGKGLVGYGIYVTVYVSDARIDEKVDQQKNLKLAYYIKSDTSREYKVNEFKLTN